jgi:hypothetical protein
VNPTGPDHVLLETYPASGTTNFDDDEVRFTFDKFVDRNSFARM